MKKTIIAIMVLTSTYVQAISPVFPIQIPMDTVVINIGNSSQIMILVEDPEELKEISQYDVNAMLKELSETVDNAGTRTLGQIEINIVPFTMERNLLWVDDYFSTDFNQVLWAVPTETQHDTFWVNICRSATGFNEERDVYDVAGMNMAAPRSAGPR